MCPSGTWLGHVNFLRYVFVLDIFCQQLWVVVQLGGCPIVLDIFCQQLSSVIQLRGCLCALRAPGWGMYIF